MCVPCGIFVRFLKDKRGTKSAVPKGHQKTKLSLNIVNEKLCKSIICHHLSIKSFKTMTYMGDWWKLCHFFLLLNVTINEVKLMLKIIFHYVN